MAEDQELLPETEAAQKEAGGEMETSDQPQLSAGGSESSLGTPYVRVTPPETSEAPTESHTESEDAKKRRPVNLVTSWGPKATKLKVTAAAGPAGGLGGLAKPLRRSIPSLGPQLPPKSQEVKQQQVTGGGICYLPGTQIWGFWIGK